MTNIDPTFREELMELGVILDDEGIEDSTQLSLAERAANIDISQDLRELYVATRDRAIEYLSTDPATVGTSSNANFQMQFSTSLGGHALQYALKIGELILNQGVGMMERPILNVIGIAPGQGTITTNITPSETPTVKISEYQHYLNSVLFGE